MGKKLTVPFTTTKVVMPSLANPVGKAGVYDTFTGLLLKLLASCEFALNPALLATGPLCAGVKLDSTPRELTALTQKKKLFAFGCACCTTTGVEISVGLCGIVS